MRITNPYGSTIERTAPAKPVQTTAKSGATEAANDGGGSILDVKVSGEAQARAAGIEQLKARVQSGSFKVDADAIASKLVGE